VRGEYIEWLNAMYRIYSMCGVMMARVHMYRMYSLHGVIRARVHTHRMYSMRGQYIPMLPISSIVIVKHSH
jgi:hypothetical protein